MVQTCRHSERVQSSERRMAKPSVKDGRSHDNTLFVTVKVPGGLDTSETLAAHRKIPHSKCRASRAKVQCKGMFLGMVGEVPGSASLQREIQRLERRGAEGAEAVAHAAREDGGVPTRAAKEESHTRQVFAHAHAGEDGQLLVLLVVRVLHRTTCEWACGTVSRNRAELGRSTLEAQGWQEPKRRTMPGGANLACGGLG